MTRFAARPLRRIEAAIQRFRDGEITLGRAAELAGMTRWRFQELLALRGVPIEIEARPVEELDAAIAKLLRQRP